MAGDAGGKKVGAEKVERWTTRRMRYTRRWRGRQYRGKVGAATEEYRWRVELVELVGLWSWI